ncbi:MAG: hypothetical protein H6591_02830 [Flavobacteriales bacterium]|nr:hypothetical protein [Flavobacteriales bacterium]
MAASLGAIPLGARLSALTAAAFALLASISMAQSLGGGGGNNGGGSVGLPFGLLRDARGTLNTSLVRHPRDFETRLLGGLGVGLQQADLVTDSGGGSAGTFPWPGLLGEFGGSVTYRDRVGLTVQGSWGFTGYMLILDSVNYRLYHTSTRAELRAFWLLRPRGDSPSLWKIGAAWGFTMQRDDELTREIGSYQNTSAAPAATRAFFAPELGRFGAQGKDRFELTLRYVIHLDGRDAWRSDAVNGSRTATYAASDNYLGLVVRYHIGFRKEQAVHEAVPPSRLTDRHADTLAVLTTRQRRITLRLWDNAEYDGDTISVLLNNRPVLVAHELTKQHQRLVLDLGPGHNTIRVIAHNEGRVPPNTASCVVRRGRGREELLIKTKPENDQLLLIELLQ